MWKLQSHDQKFIKRQNLCFNCLKRDHRAEKCPSTNRCFHPECAEPLPINTPFGWTIFGSSEKCFPTETKKAAVNITMLSSELELNDNVKKFWEFDSKIAESANESGYSQEDVKCIKKLHQETKWLQGKYEVPMLWIDKGKSYQITSIQHSKGLDHKRKGYEKIQICVTSIKTQCGNTSKMDMQKSCRMRKLTKQVKGLGICPSTQFSMNISQTKLELSLILQQTMMVWAWTRHS